MTFEQHLASLKDYTLDEILAMIRKSGGRVCTTK